MSSEVGAGHVSIFPVMTGFRKQVDSEVGASAASASRTFADRFKSAGSRAGATLGEETKASFAVTAKDLGSTNLKKLQSDVAAASRALSKSRLSQQDAAGRVRVAETQLQETLKKYPAGTSQAVRAEERLETMRRRSAEAASAVSTASDRLKASQESLASAQERVTSATEESGSAASAVSTASDRLKASQESLASAQERVTSATEESGSAASDASAKFSAFLQGAASKAGSAARSIGGALKGAVSGAVDALRGPATAVVGAVATTAGVALTKGFGRLKAIEESSATLRGLGNDAQTVEQIMKNAGAAVRGTAFGLGEAATTAAGAVAAGLRPGKQLEGVLKGVANVAAASKAPMDEIGVIYNKVAAGQRAYTENISQLADRGLPIWQELENQLGVTSEQVRKMASKGEIDFDTFAAAASAAAGTVADEMGRTLGGSTANFFASLGRVGANLLSGIYPQIAPLIQAVTGALAPIEEKAEKVGQILGERVGPVIERLTGFFEKLQEGTSGVASRFSELVPVIAPVAGGLLALGSGGLAGLLSRIPMLGGMLGGLGGAFKILGGPLGLAIGGILGLVATGGDVAGFADGFTGMIGSVVAMVPELVDTVVQALPRIVEGIISSGRELMGAGSTIFYSLLDGLVAAIPELAGLAVEIIAALADTLTSLIPSIVGYVLSALPQLLSAGAEIIQTLLAAIVKALPLLVGAASEIIGRIGGALITLLPEIVDAAISLVQSLLDGIIQALPLIIEGALLLVTSLLETIVSLLPVIIEGGIELLMSLVTGLIDALPFLLEAALTLVTSLLMAIMDNLPLIIQAGIDLILSLITGLIAALPQIITTAITLVLELVSGLLGMLPELVTAALEMVIAIAGGLIAAIPELIAAIPELISAIVDAFMGMDWIQLGKDLIMGVINGIKGMAGALWDAAKSTFSGMFDGVKNFFGINSPSKLMEKEIGEPLPQGAAKGVRNKADLVARETEAMARKAADRAANISTHISTVVDEAPTSGLFGPQSPPPPGAGAATGGVQIHNHGVDAAELGQRTFAQFQHWVDEEVGAIR